MGLIADMAGALARVIPERKIAIGATVPTWESGTPQYPRGSYWRFSTEGYGANELVYASIEELCSSASEPRIAAVAKTAKGPEKVKDHEVLDLFEHPNPFMSRVQFIATIVMYRSIAGNAYIEKVRSAAGKVVELWPLRPDRMFVIPDAQKHIRGYEYRLGAETFFIDAGDVIHTKTRNPTDDWYGLSPMAVAAGRIDTDNAARAFTFAFFRNAGVPAGMLTLTKTVGAAERQMIRDRFRGETGGMSAHSLMVLDNTEATYTPMGLPLGDRGLVLPDLDEISEARIPMVWGVPLELIGARLGMIHGNRSTMKEARAGFWDETLTPIYEEIGSDLSLGLTGEYDGFDYLEFDLSTVKALQEDQDSKHTRIRADAAAGLISVQEARVDLGREPDFEPGAILILPDNLSPLPVEQLAAPPEPTPSLQPAGGAAVAAGNGRANGHTNGAMTPADLAALQELAAGR